MNNFSAYSIIAKKRDGKKLSSEEIKWFINEYTSKKIPDYQMSALLMAIYLKGLNAEETSALTDAMLYSGTVLDFKDISVIDKHSTGGVGDKTSFILAPIAAAAGVKVPMIAGRGLGHTGGTVDKIEAVKGFRTDLNTEEFKNNLNKYGMVLIGQTADIAPADKLIYALRDVTATVESIPLITASIMSKKLAEGASGIVMDIKCGKGAFMKTFEDANLLAKSIRDTAIRFNKNIITMITDMSGPLGNMVGNSLEIIESIETLKNKGPKDLTDISVELAGGMIHLAKITSTLDKGIERAREILESGKGVEKFRELIKIQGGDPTVVDDYSKLPLAKKKTIVTAQANGFIEEIDGLSVGLHCVDLGGGRRKTTDKIDYGVGFNFFKKEGSEVKKGDPILEIYHHDNQQAVVDTITKNFNDKIIKITKEKVIPRKQIFETEITWS